MWRTDNEASQSRPAFPPRGTFDQNEQSFQQVHQSAAGESISWYIPALCRLQIPVCMENQGRLELDLTGRKVKRHVGTCNSQTNLAMLLCAPAVHSNSSLDASNTLRELDTNPFKYFLSALITYSIPESTTSRLPFVINTLPCYVISNIIRSLDAVPLFLLSCLC